jgi:acetyl esterase/lipase
MIRSITLLVFTTILCHAEEVRLWPGVAPGSEGITAKEIVEPPNDKHNYLKVWSIHAPSITVFLPPKEKATGAAVIIAPGGAHQFLAFDIEGINVANYLTSIGVSAFVLKYRLAREEGSPYKVEVHPLLDAQRAIRLVRSRAREWYVDPKRIGIMGFSAGGAVAAMAATRYDNGKPDDSDPVERLGSRPDFQILIYPGIRAETLTITKDTPPAFLLCADNDRNPSITVGSLYMALKKEGVPTEVHVYASGGHGFGIRVNPRPNPIASTWFLRLRDWMSDRKLLSGTTTADRQ